MRTSLKPAPWRGPGRSRRRDHAMGRHLPRIRARWRVATPVASFRQRIGGSWPRKETAVTKKRALKTDTQPVGSKRQLCAKDLPRIGGGAGNAAIDFAIKPPA
jgi:hypothetical protein